MGFFDVIGKIGSALIEEGQRKQSEFIDKKSKEARKQGKPEPKLGGKTYREWDWEWKHLGVLDSANLSPLSHTVGLYRAKLNGEIVYIGRAKEFSNGGLRKRLSDYTRPSDSGRKHQSGQLMHANASDLKIDILATGSDSNAAEIARKLEIYFVGKHKPKWNKMLK